MSSAAVLWAGAVLLAASDLPPDLRLCADLADNVARLACYDRAVGRAPEPVIPPAADPEKFGLPPTKAERDSEINSMRSRLVGEFTGWEPGLQFTLINGQVWKAVSDDSAFYSDVPVNPEVVITRNFFGAYWMEIVSLGRRVKVKRVK